MKIIDAVLYQHASGRLVYMRYDENEEKLYQRNVSHCLLVTPPHTIWTIYAADTTHQALICYVLDNYPSTIHTFPGVKR
jgi:hypothetical protein